MNWHSLSKVDILLLELENVLIDLIIGKHKGKLVV